MKHTTCAGWTKWNRSLLLVSVCGASLRLTRRQGLDMPGRRWRVAAACWTCLALASCSHRPAVTPVSADIWNPKSGEFHWPLGKVTLPKGMSYWLDQMGAQYEARLSSPRTRLHIEIVVPECPGAKAWSGGSRSTDGAKLEFEEKAVEDGRAWIGRGDPDPRRHRPGGNWVLGAVTFPDAGCATFYLDSNSSKDAAVIDEIVRSFRPRGHPSLPPPR